MTGELVFCFSEVVVCFLLCVLCDLKGETGSSLVLRSTGLLFSHGVAV